MDTDSPPDTLRTGHCQHCRDERERCALLCEALAESLPKSAAQAARACAEAIRKMRSWR